MNSGDIRLGLWVKGVYVFCFVESLVRTWVDFRHVLLFDHPL